MPYEDAWARQREMHAEVVGGHPTDDRRCCSSTRRSTPPASAPRPASVPSDGTPVVDVDRGGKITWHGPGQLVGYPIVRLADPIDVVAYVRRLEGVLIDVCAELGVTRATQSTDAAGPGCRPTTAVPTARWPPSASGWPRASRCTGSRSTATPTCTWFDRIVPCGISDAGVTSLSRESGRDVTVAEVLPIVETHLPALIGEVAAV